MNSPIYLRRIFGLHDGVWRFEKILGNYHLKIVVRHNIYTPPFFVSSLLGNRLKSVRHFGSFFRSLSFNQDRSVHCKQFPLVLLIFLNLFRRIHLDVFSILILPYTSLLQIRVPFELCLVKVSTRKNVHF